MADQIELFTVAEPAPAAARALERSRAAAALRCLRDAVGESLHVVATLRYPHSKDSRAPKVCDPWAYCVCAAGIRAEATEDWWAGARDRGEVWGWDRLPPLALSWDELATLIGDDPRRAEIADWIDRVPEPKWRQLERPYAMWPQPGQWNRGYLERECLDPEWPARRRAWELTLDVLDDALRNLPKHC